MNILDVKNQIISKSVDKFYVFTGEERSILNIYVHKIFEVANQQMQVIDSVSQATTRTTFSLLGEVPGYVCYDDFSFLDDEKLWDDFQDKLGEDSVLVVVYSKIDKRSKFYKRFEDRIVTFDALSPVILTKYLKPYGLSEQNCSELVRICENDYGRLMNEADKIRCMSESSGSAADDAFESLLEDGIIYQPPEDAIFDWVAALLDGKMGSSFRLYEECLRIGEPALRLLLVLYNNVKHLLQVQACEGNVEQVTGLKSWEINLVKDKANKAYSNGELVQAMKTIKLVETAIKTGDMEEQNAVPYVMVQMLR